MKANIKIISIFIVMTATLAGGKTTAQRVTSPCPEVLINEKYDHVPLRQYRAQGWDTAVTCENRRIMLSAEPYIPVQYFTGNYIVESIPYNPPDTSFWMNGQGTKLAINNDDDFAAAPTQIAYPFYFFGLRKTQFRIGDNGMVTFTSTAMTDVHYNGPFCPFQVNSPIPWTPSAGNNPGGSSNFDRTHDAIYGVYEDTYTGSGGSHMSGHQGIYYGVMDSYPCRKILCTWNQIPVFSDATKRQSYQIVCYEGSNIIEVHVKQRCAKPSTSQGLIGIQNATGLPQVHGDGVDPVTNMWVSNKYVVDGSPASFAAPGWNLQSATSGTINNVAFRFTPEGITMKSYFWYRIFDDGRDSVVLGQDQNDTNGYFVPMTDNGDHPTLTKAWVRPTVPSRYVMELRFQNASGDWYYLKDTVFVGVDTAADLNLSLPGAQAANGKRRDICQGENATANLSYPGTQEAQSIRWTVKRIINGQSVILPTSMYGVGGGNQSLTLLPDPRFDTLPTNKIDTIVIQASVTFVSGCSNFDTAMVRIFPNFDTTVIDGICQGQTYHWNPAEGINLNFTENTDPEIAKVTLQSLPGCDSVVHLALTVFDVSLTIDDTLDCKPIVWKNGRTYYETNTATANTDTIVLQNRYGCDSIVRLNFTIHPLTARLQSSLDHFTLDQLDVELTDISTGGDSRRWVFPTASEQTGATAYYTIPANLDEADIKLIAHSPYGCVDSTHIVIPLQKETFWIPNAFTPDNPTGNNLFSTISTQTVNQEMYIYNRMGALVFHCEGVDCAWDGRDNNGNPCPQGSYVYVIRYTNAFEPNLTRVRKGAVTLIR